MTRGERTYRYKIDRLLLELKGSDDELVSGCIAVPLGFNLGSGGGGGSFVLRARGVNENLGPGCVRVLLEDLNCGSVVPRSCYLLSIASRLQQVKT